MTSLALRSLIIAATICFGFDGSSAQQFPASVQAQRVKIPLSSICRGPTTPRPSRKLIHEEVGGTMVALELETPYPANYTATVEQVARENETGYLPPLKTKIEGIHQYDVVFLGFPTWAMQLPPPVKSFLGRTDLTGKTVIPFNTNAGYGEGSSFRM